MRLILETEFEDDPYIVRTAPLPLIKGGGGGGGG